MESATEILKRRMKELAQEQIDQDMLVNVEQDLTSAHQHKLKVSKRK